DAVVLSTETNLVVAARCRKLKIAAHQGLREKGQALRHLVSAKGLEMDQVAYIGNDVNDLECLSIAGVAVAPADAYPAVQTVADSILRNCGGHGAVREICELAIAAHQSRKAEYAGSKTR